MVPLECFNRNLPLLHGGARYQEENALVPLPFQKTKHQALRVQYKAIIYFFRYYKSTSQTHTLQGWGLRNVKFPDKLLAGLGSPLFLTRNLQEGHFRRFIDSVHRTIKLHVWIQC